MNKRLPEPTTEEQFEQLKDALIMMVDDEPIMMDLVQVLLEEEGYRNFITIEDSTRALAAIEEHRPDILLLDLMMPNVDGFEILDSIRHNPVNRFLPVIVLTSSTDSESKIRALELGASDFLAKPVDASELALRLRNTLIVKAYQDRLTYYDALTQLPNRKLFVDRLDWSLKRAVRKQETIAVLLLQLDRFSKINETFGPRTGDELLIQVASRLKLAIREEDVIKHVDRWRSVARISGDSFAMLLPDIKHIDDASFVARRILDSLTEPFELEGHEVFTTGNIGLAISPQDGIDSDNMMKHASVANQFAKGLGRGTYQFYSEELNATSRDTFKLESDLYRALERNELELHYQPKVRVSDGKPVGIEALIRWQHPELGMIPPFRFIPLTEENGLIVPIGIWIFRTACQQIKHLEATGYADVKISINVSAVQIAEADFISMIDQAIKETGINPEKLIIEITESVVMKGVETNLKILHEIQALGVSLSIDDFGTGYSSLSYLKRFPIQELKIDKSFLDEVEHSEEDAAIIKAIIALAHTLELTVTAEGVEDQYQVDFLKTHKCDIIQGYFYSKPLPEAELLSFLASQT